MTDPAKEDVELLLAAVLPFGRSMIERHGEFHPYGGYLKLDRTVVDVGAEIRGQEHPAPEELVKLMRAEFVRLRRQGELLAAAVVTHVRIVPPEQEEASDAIHVSLEHAEAYSVEVFEPYREDADGAFTFGHPFAFAQEGSYWLQDA